MSTITTVSDDAVAILERISCSSLLRVLEVCNTGHNFRHDTAFPHENTDVHVPALLVRRSETYNGRIQNVSILLLMAFFVASRRGVMCALMSCLQPQSKSWCSV